MAERKRAPDLPQIARELLLAEAAPRQPAAGVTGEGYLLHLCQAILEDTRALSSK